MGEGLDPYWKYNFQHGDSKAFDEVQQTVDESIKFSRDASREQILREMPSLEALNEEEITNYINRFKQY